MSKAAKSCHKSDCQCGCNK